MDLGLREDRTGAHLARGVRIGSSVREREGERGDGEGERGSSV